MRPLPSGFWPRFLLVIVAHGWATLVGFSVLTAIAQQPDSAPQPWDWPHWPLAVTGIVFIMGLFNALAAFLTWANPWWWERKERKR